MTVLRAKVRTPGKPYSLYLVLPLLWAEKSGSTLCIPYFPYGIRVVGKGSWKDREVGKIQVGKIYVGNIHQS